MKRLTQTGFWCGLAFLLCWISLHPVTESKQVDGNCGKRFVDFPPSPFGSWTSTAVATDTPECSRVADAVILQQKGGSAVDAAIFTALCLGVLSPSSSGVGGGAVMMIHNIGDNSSDDVVVIDCREEAPAAANATMYVNNSNAQSYGPLSAAVPGLFQCLWAAHQRYGVLSWADVVTEAANIARNFTVSKFLANAIASNQALLLQDPALAQLFFVNGVPKKEGDFVQWTSLANTMDAIAQNGVGILYGGRLGQQLANDVQAAGGIITAQDLSNYRAVIRQPVKTFFAGYELFSAPLPFGGPVMLMAFNILEGYLLPANCIIQHWMLESWKFAYDDRLALGDPSFVPNASLYVDIMLNKEHAATLRQRLNPDHTLPSPADYSDLFPLINAPEPHGTTHFNVVTGTQAVAMTSTVNLAFGSKYISPSTGILLNDEMDDFSSPGVSNYFGYPPSPNNFIQPGKRPMSSMSPTLVKRNGELFMAVGASGGSRIITATFQTILNLLYLNMHPADAVGAPRLHDQLLPDLCYVEPLYPVAQYDYFLGANTLTSMGYNVTAGGYQSVVQLIVRELNNSSVTLHAVSDYRKYGAPAGSN